MPKIGIEEIARLAGVSAGTVDRALHGRKGISETTRKRVLEIARQYGYETNWAARALARGRHNVRIGVCIPTEFDFVYGRVRDGIVHEADRHKHLGVELLFAPVARPGQNEIEAVRAMRAAGVDAIVMTPGDPRTVGPEIDAAERDGIRVVCVISDAAGTARSTAVCVDPELNGRLAAELMGMLVPPGAEVAVIAGILSTDDQRLKVSAFSEALPRYCPGGSVVEVLRGNDDEPETFDKCVRMLDNRPTLGGIYVSNAMCLPVCYLLCARGRSGAVRLVTTDFFKSMVPYFENGTISACIHQIPFRQGQTAVQLIVDHVTTGTAMPKSRYLDPAIVLHSNLSSFCGSRDDAASADGSGELSDCGPPARGNPAARWS